MAQDFVLKLRIDADGKRAESEFKKLEGKSGRLGATLSRTLSSFAGNVAANAVSRLTSAAVDGVNELVRYSASMEQTQIGFETLIGSAEGATKHLKELQEFAATTPFEFEGLAKMSRRLLGAKVATEDIIPIMTDLGNIVAATGDTSIERFEGINRAVTQIIGKGKVLAEEMEQLAERGVPAWQLLEEATGRNQAELRKMAEQGKISSDVLIQALQKVSRQKFSDAMARQAEAFNGAITKIKDNIRIIAYDMFKPIFDQVRSFTSRFAKNLTAQKAESRSLFAAFGETLGEAWRDGFTRGSRGDKKLPAAFWLTPWGASFLGMAAGAGFQKGLNEEVVSNFASKMKEFQKQAGMLGGGQIDLGAAVDPEAEKAIKAVAAAYQDLTFKLKFFGDETEVAQTTIRLATSGVRNWDDANVKATLGLAAQLDILKKQAEAQDKVKDVLGDLENQWNELTLTSDQIRRKDLKRWWDGLGGVLQQKLLPAYKKINYWLGKVEAKAFEVANNQRIGGLFKTLESDLRALNPVADDTANIFREKLFGYFESFDIKQSIEEMGQLAEDIFQIHPAARQGALEELLAPLVDRETGRAIFANSKDLEKAAEGLIRVYDSIENGLQGGHVQEGFQQLNDALYDLGITFQGFGFVTEMERLNRILADEKTQAALTEWSKALGIAKDELEEMLKLAAESRRLAQGATRPRFVETRGPLAVGFMDEFDNATGKIRTFDDTLRQLGSTSADVLMQMGAGLGDMIGQWALLGGAADVSFRKMVATVLSGVATQAATLAIFHTAMGIAALTPWGAAVYGPAPLHFKAALIWGALAASTAIGGRFAAGNEFSDGASGGVSGARSSNRAHEDYRPITSNRPLSTGSGQSQGLAELGAQVAVLGATMSKLTEKIGSMRPGDVVTAGMRSSGTRSFVTEKIIEDVRKNSTTMTKAGRALRLE